MKNNYMHFFYLTLFSVVFGYISKELLETDTIFVNSMIEQFTNEQINEILEVKEKW